MLRGVDADDWPKVQQAAVEVHDVHGRLDACVALLRRHRFATTVVAQATSTEKGYLVAPPALKLFYVYRVLARTHCAVDFDRARRQKRRHLTQSSQSPA